MFIDISILNQWSKEWMKWINESMLSKINLALCQFHQPNYWNLIRWENSYFHTLCSRLSECEYNSWIGVPICIQKGFVKVVYKNTSSFGITNFILKYLKFSQNILWALTHNKNYIYTTTVATDTTKQILQLYLSTSKAEWDIYVA